MTPRDPDVYRDLAKQIEGATLHNARLSDPPVQARGSRSGYLNAPYGNDPERFIKPGPRGPAGMDFSKFEPLKPLYTEKLPTSPHFPSLAEAARRRRDFWMKLIARAGIAMMVAAPIVAYLYGTGKFPAGAFVAGLIIFAGTCFVNGNCRSRV